MFLAGAALCAAVSIGAVNEGDGTTRLLVIMGILIAAFLGGAGWQFWLAITNASLRVVVLERGIASIRGGKANLLRFDDITSVTQQITDQYRYGVKVNTSHVYRVRLQDGRKVVFSDVIKNVAALGETIQHEATVRLLPDAIRRLETGIPLTFGKLVVSRDGIGTGQEIVPWSQVDPVKFNAGFITISRQGKKLAGGTQSAGKTPNLYVFLALVERMRRSRSAS